MIDDRDLGFFTNTLGVLIMVLVVLYHYVAADARLAQ